MYVWSYLLCFIRRGSRIARICCLMRRSSGIARQSPLQGVSVSECNYKRGPTVGAQYLTAEGGIHEDRNGTRERGRRGILGDDEEGMIAVGVRAGEGERERK